MNFAEQIARIQSAASDPRKLALAVLDIVLASQPPDLRRALEAAAVLRWFDEPSLAAVLDEDLRDNVALWLDRLRTLPAVEPAPGRNAWNVHETTRRAPFSHTAVRRLTVVSDPSNPSRRRKSSAGMNVARI